MTGGSEVYQTGDVGEDLYGVRVWPSCTSDESFFLNIMLISAFVICPTDMRLAHSLGA